MINTKIVAWLEKSLGAMVALVGLGLAFMSTTGLVRVLTVVIVVLFVAAMFIKNARTEVDEREVYLHYVSNTMAFLCTFTAILGIGIYQYLQYGVVAKPVALLMVISGVSQAVFGVLLRRVA